MTDEDKGKAVEITKCSREASLIKTKMSTYSLVFQALLPHLPTPRQP